MAASMEMEKASQYKSVAKEMESMLKVALEQLKAEQKLRKEANATVDKLKQELKHKEKSIIELDYKVMMMQHNMDLSETELSKRQTLIESLKSTVKRLLAKERESFCKQNDSKIPQEKLKVVEKTKESDNLEHIEDDLDNIRKYKKIPRVSNFKNTTPHKDNLFENDTPKVKSEISPDFVQDIVQHFKGTDNQQKVHSKGRKNQSMSDVKDIDNSREVDYDDFSPCIKKETCNQDFITETIMKTSERPCDMCDKIFSSSKLLRQHKDQHHSRFKCLYCPKTFKSEANQIKHEDSSHDKQYQCKRCPRRFRTLENCRKHEVNDSFHNNKRRSAPSAPLLNCPVCGKLYDGKQKWGFEKHMKSHKLRAAARGGYRLGDGERWRE